MSGWYIYFWQTHSPRTASIDGVIIQTAILSISGHCTETKMAFFGILRSYWFRNTHFYSKIPSRKFDLTWPDVDLILLRLQNGVDFLIMRVTTNHVPNTRKRILFWWPFVTWRWPWPVLSVKLAPSKSSLAFCGYFGWVSSERYPYCRP